MIDGPIYPETDCLSPAMVDSSLPYWGPTVTNLFNASAPLPTNVSRSPLGSWPNVISSLCTMSLCNKIYTSEVQHGFLNEQIIDETQLLSTYNQTASEVANDLPGNTVSIPSKCAAFNQMYDITDFLDVNAYKNAGASSNFSDLQKFVTNQTLLEACSYSTSSLVSQTLQRQLPSFFTGSAIFTNLETDYTINAPSFNHLDPQAQTTRTNESIKTSFGDTPQLAPLLGDGNVSVSSMSTLFHNLAETMTNHMRQKDSQQASAQGLTYSMQSTVYVAWPWLIFPTVIAVGSCVFLALTLYSVKNHMNHDMVWRSSQGALLYHGLHERDSHGALVSQESMEKAEKGTMVRLGMEETGWRLVVDDSGNGKEGPAVQTREISDARCSSTSPLVENRAV